MYHFTHAGTYCTVFKMVLYWPWLCFMIVTWQYMHTQRFMASCQFQACAHACSKGALHVTGNTHGKYTDQHMQLCIINTHYIYTDSGWHICHVISYSNLYTHGLFSLHFLKNVLLNTWNSTHLIMHSSMFAKARNESMHFLILLMLRTDCDSHVIIMTL